MGSQEVQGSPAAGARDRLGDALKAAEDAARAHDFASRHHARVSDVLAAMGKRAEAIARLVAASRLPAGPPADLEALGFTAFGLGEHQLARDWYAQVVDAVPSDGLAWYNLATGERNLGRLDLAESACNRALALDASLVQAALLRSHVRTQTADRHHVDDLRLALARAGQAPAAEIFLHYALGKELDDLGDYDQAFGHFEQGARARRASLAYDVEQDLFKLRRIQAAFDDHRLSRAPTLQAPAYGFILGLPRSGTTMIERVLTGNELVRTNGETDNLLGALSEGAPPGGGDVFDRVASADPLRVAEGYARRAGRPTAGGLILEKLPLNYLYGGALRLTLPHARTLLVTRAPADNCFAMFSTLFGSGYPFSYDLQDLAAYYQGYRELMLHWKRRLGDQLMDVAYEDFIADPEALGAQVAAHMGADWTQSMVRIEDNRSASATASAAQIRRPIYRTAAGRWRNYAKHLEPFLEVLEAAGLNPQDGRLPS